MQKPSKKEIQPEPIPHVLYRFWQKDRLLYIGISKSFLSRMDSHNRLKEWFELVTKITVEHYPNRAAVLAAEKNAIQREHPIYNLQHNDKLPAALRHLSTLQYQARNGNLTYTGHATLFDEIRKSLNTNRISVTKEMFALLVTKSYESTKLVEHCSECSRMVDWPEVRVLADKAAKLMKGIEK